MTDHYKAIVRDINGKLREFNTRMPDTMKGFDQLTVPCHSEGALSPKTKELIATAIAIAVRCEGCLGFHARSCVRQGVSRAEFEEMLQVAIYMGGGPSLMTGAQAMLAYEEFGGEAAS